MDGVAVIAIPSHKASRPQRNAAQRIAQLELAIEIELSKEKPDAVRIAQLGSTIDKIRGGAERKANPAAHRQAKRSDAAVFLAERKDLQRQAAFMYCLAERMTLRLPKSTVREIIEVTKRDFYFTPQRDTAAVARREK